MQVLFNLIRNSAHAIEDKKDSKIIVKTENDGDYVKVQVIDNGTGIDKDKIDKIWELFFTTKGEKGTGLGLDICKRIINGHNGKIECSSNPGEETAFTIFLPLLFQENPVTIK